MSISDDEIKNISDLSRLDLDDSERNELREDLNEILDFAEKIQELDTEEVEPTYHAIPLENVGREDETRTSSASGTILEHAPDSSDDYFVVPKVIDES